MGSSPMTIGLQFSRSASGQTTPGICMWEGEETLFFFKMSSVLEGITMCFCHLTPESKKPQLLIFSVPMEEVAGKVCLDIWDIL